jgi:iron complex outermembrane receptor protein
MIMARMGFKWAIAAFICCVMVTGLSAQQITIKGKLKDGTDNTPMAGATYAVPSANKGGLTDEEGNYVIKVDRAPEIEMLFRSMGYGDTTVVIKTESGKNIYEVNVILGLKDGGVVMNDVVFTAGRHAQDPNKVVSSIEVVNSAKVDLQASNEVEDVLQQSPGVDIIDGQPNIRGSSGYAYGVGSRVLLMLNGLPLLSPDASFAQFDLIPVDNINQIEIMKGASSVLYGSSALGGVINVLTNDAPDTAKTSIRLTGTIYDAPADPLLDWDGDKSAKEGSINIFHSRKIGNNDLTVLGGFWKESGWRYDTEAENGRVMVMTKFRPKKVPGLNWGINASYRFDSSRTFLFWDSYLPGDTVITFTSDTIFDSKGALSGQSSRRLQYNDRFTIDPFIKYLTPKNNMHYYRGRIMGNRNTNDTRQSNNNQLVYNDYQFTTRLWNDKITWVTGVTNQFNFANGDSLYGDVRVDTVSCDSNGQNCITDSVLIGGHYVSMNAAIYTQMDAELTPRLTASVGARYDFWYIGGGEQYGNKIEQSPVFRAGLNYNAFAGNNIRASFGQAFRSPSVAERFTSTNASGLLILPNPDISTEKGFSAEIGIRQGFKTGLNNKKYLFGYVDLAGFMMDYNNMIEFGIVQPETLDIFNFDPAFSARNVTNARILGAEITALAQGQINDFFFNFSGGVTYLDPRNLNPVADSQQVNIRDSIGPQNDPRNFATLEQFLSLALPNDDPNRRFDNPGFLKYRSKWLIRASATVGYGRFSLTGNFRYKSEIVNIDQFLYLAIPGSADWVRAHPGGFLLVDLIAGADLVNGMKISLNVKNALNTEWAELPGIIGKQRSFSVQLKYVF